MAYTPASPNKYDQGIIPFKVRNKYFMEYIGLTPISVFMGTSPYDIVQVMEMSNGEGGSYTFPFKKEGQYINPITGYDQAEGSEDKPVVYSKNIPLNELGFTEALMGVRLVKQLTPVEIFGMLRESLIRKQQRYLVKSILDTACGLPAVGGLYNPATQIPSYDRAIACGALNAIAATRAGWIGALNLNAVVAAQNAGTAHNQNGLSVQHIRTLKTYAIAGGAPDVFEGEAKIMPVEVKSKKGFPDEMYVYMIDPLSYISLANDPQWSQFMYRGVIQNSDQPEGISGARYRGMVDGVLVYECPELARYRLVSGGFTAAWNLFLGAQAFGLVWSQRPWFAEERRDYGRNIGMGVFEIRGQTALTFPSYQAAAQLPAGLTDIEHGIIHSFPRIA